MQLTIERAHNIDEYLEAWRHQIRDYEWARESIPFHYAVEEERQEIQEDFEKEHHWFLVAYDKTGRPVGVLGMRLNGETCVLRNWEPATQSNQAACIAHQLLDTGFETTRKEGAVIAFARLKYTLPLRSKAANLKERLLDFGFSEKRRGITSICDLNHTRSLEGKMLFRDRDAFTLDELTDMTVKSFAYEEEDRSIHGEYQSVSDREANRRIMELIEKGVFGNSPPELWQIALVDDRPAGLVIGFIPESEYRPPHGVVGQLCVLPGFRRRGVATALLRRIHQEFQSKGCEYAFVGTPRSNRRALNLYEREEYRRRFGQDEFEMRL